MPAEAKRLRGVSHRINHGANAQSTQAVARALEAELIACLFQSLVDAVLSDLFARAVLHVQQPHSSQLGQLVGLRGVSIKAFLTRCERLHVSE